MVAAAIRHTWRGVRNRTEIVRAPDWWEFKLAPVLAIFWGVILGRGVALLPLIGTAALLVAAVAVCAVFVSVLNDLTDLRVDRLAGKANRMRDLPPPVRAALLGVSALVGLAIAAAWRGHPALAAAYLGAFLAFILYSLPPLRFKGRGVLGVVGDAAGAHLFPTLAAVLLAFAVLAVPAEPVLLAAAGTWAFALGLRGIIWHQLGDLAADGRASVRTLPRIFRPASVVRFGERIVFPVELTALLLFLWTVHAVVACLFLAFHLGLLWLRFRREGVQPAIVAPRLRAAIALHEYYALWLPAAFILQSSLRHPFDLWLLLVQILLFPGRTRQAAGEIWHMRRPRPA